MVKGTDRNGREVPAGGVIKDPALTEALEAMNDLGIFRLGARIWDLKQAGIQIRSDWMVVKNRFGEDCRIKKYWIA